MPVVHATVTTEPIDTPALLALVEAPSSGAVACFLGRIRNHDPEAFGEVVSVDYTHHPDAARILAAVTARETANRDPEGRAHVVAVHRVGHLAVGDDALLVAVASPHRHLAFALCPAIVEAIKRDVPIWKQQTEADGSTVWSELGLDG